MKPPGYDLSDWVRDGGTKEVLLGLGEQAPAWEPPAQADLETSPPTRGGMVGGGVSGALPQEFNFLVLRQKAEGEGFELRFLPFLDADELRLICLGFSTLIASYPKGGKTSLLFSLARQWAVAGHSILYLTEEPETIWKARLSAAPEDGLDRMVGVPGLGVNPASLLQRAAEGAEDIVIVDTTNLLGIQDGNDSATVWAALAPWVEMARARSKTIIFAHHTNKSIQGDLRSVAGSYNFAAIVDCVLVLCPDEAPGRRVLGGASRIFAVEPVMYELEDGQLRCLGDPRSVSLEAVTSECIEVLSISPGERKKTNEVLAAIGEPKPSLAQVQQALAKAAADSRILRDPPIDQGKRPGTTYRWYVPGAETSPPTIPPLVGGEVEGSARGYLPMAPEVGGQ